MLIVCSLYAHCMLIVCSLYFQAIAITRISLYCDSLSMIAICQCNLSMVSAMERVKMCALKQSIVTSFQLQLVQLQLVWIASKTIYKRCWRSIWLRYFFLQLILNTILNTLLNCFFTHLTLSGRVINMKTLIQSILRDLYLLQHVTRRHFLLILKN